ncbi:MULTISPECIES: hypothetical protein [unclassified Pseudonocardia]|uniref:hypothetical protein n=1 Tax=unclassified Pseudonocardia TaxID=2619320 RepID=UPI000A8295FB|nr:MULTISPECIES: hypothetical protein [unclassified Pseudonocardia]
MSAPTYDIVDGYTERDALIVDEFLSDDWENTGPAPVAEWEIDLGDEEPPF